VGVQRQGEGELQAHAADPGRGQASSRVRVRARRRTRGKPATDPGRQPTGWPAARDRRSRLGSGGGRRLGYRRLDVIATTAPRGCGRRSVPPETQTPREAGSNRLNQSDVALESRLRREA
jgi:hypothetical protein